MEHDCWQGKSLALVLWQAWAAMESQFARLLAHLWIHNKGSQMPLILKNSSLYNIFYMTKVFSFCRRQNVMDNTGISFPIDIITSVEVWLRRTIWSFLWRDSSLARIQRAGFFLDWKVSSVSLCIWLDMFVFSPSFKESVSILCPFVYYLFLPSIPQCGSSNNTQTGLLTLLAVL